MGRQEGDDAENTHFSILDLGNVHSTEEIFNASYRSIQFEAEIEPDAEAGLHIARCL